MHHTVLKAEFALQIQRTALLCCKHFLTILTITINRRTRADLDIETTHIEDIPLKH